MLIGVLWVLIPCSLVTNVLEKHIASIFRTEVKMESVHSSEMLVTTFSTTWPQKTTINKRFDDVGPEQNAMEQLLMI
jgi:hypothetical protein